MKSKMPIKKWSSGRGALLFVAVLFAASALIRFAAGSGQAIAKEVAEFNARDEVEHAAPLCETTPGAAELARTLVLRQEEIEKKNIRLLEFEQALVLTETEVRARLAELKQAEERLSATIAKSKTAAEDDLSKLTSVYENMKPADAARLFEEMNPTFAAGFIGRMRPDAAASVMAGLSPQSAYSISVILAGRNAKAGVPQSMLPEN